MTAYIPQPGDAGFQLIQVALRDFLRADPVLVGLITAANPLAGAASIIPEGSVKVDTPMPGIIIAKLPDGNTGKGVDDHMLRLLLYVCDKGRGYSRIERIAWRVREVVNSPDCRRYLTFPPGVKPMVSSIRLTGSTDSITLPRYQFEAVGLYVFMNLIGVPIGE